MNKFKFLLLILFSASTCFSQPQLSKAEAHKAFELINDIRVNTQNYIQSFSIGPTWQVVHSPLVWNDTLAKVAEARVLDMATNNYFDHIDKNGFGVNYYIAQAGYSLQPQWLDIKSKNNFESIGRNIISAENAIKLFIIDEQSKTKGHRNQILGLTDWYKNMKDIGIGFCSVPNGTDFPTTYISIVIAKHNW